MAEFVRLALGPNNAVFKNAIFLAHAANAAYEDGGPTAYIEKYTKGIDVFGFSEAEVFTGPNDTQGFIAKSDAFTLLAFRGTEVNKLADIRTDLLSSARTWSVGNVHKGFSLAHDGVMDTYLTALMRYVDPSRPFYITGHSLGGALAMLAGQWLKLKNDPLLEPRAVYTFGAPRVGDMKFCSTYPRRLFRFVHGEDLIPHVPPPGSFTDAGSLLYLSADGKVYFNADRIPTFWQKLTASAKEWLNARGDLSQAVPKWIQDHIMQAYIDRLQALLDSGTADLFTESGEEPEQAN